MTCSTTVSNGQFHLHRDFSLPTHTKISVNRARTQPQHHNTKRKDNLHQKKHEKEPEDMPNLKEVKFWVKQKYRAVKKKTKKMLGIEQPPAGYEVLGDRLGFAEERGLGVDDEFWVKKMET